MGSQQARGVTGEKGTQQARGVTEELSFGGGD